LQLPGQLTRSSVGQSPLPLHVAPTVATAAVQLASRHDAVGPGYTQPTRVVPSQIPPHEEPSVTQAGLGACG
jgi:hypothetical protein